MRVRLLSPSEDFDVNRPDPPWADDLRRDLELDILWDAMGGGDKFLRSVARAALLHPVTDPEVVVYRQRALADVEAHRDTADRLYTLAVEALGIPRGIFMMPVTGHPSMSLDRAVRILTALLSPLHSLRDVCASAAPAFTSAAFAGMFDTIACELDDAYLHRLRALVTELDGTRGMLLSAGIGHDGRVVGQVLRRAKPGNRGLFDRTPLKRPLFSFVIPDRDDAGFEALAALRDRTVAAVAEAVTDSVDHVLGFFASLRTELGFYLCACRLADRLSALEAPVGVPIVALGAEVVADGLYDPCLAVRTGANPVGNDDTGSAGGLLVVTGANHGGKSTFLRACGVAQLMAQAGMHTPARSLVLPAVGHVLTHWAREEDAGLRHGKLDEELLRMSRLIDLAQPGDLVLCNESFASTNEAEGSQIALDVVSTLVEAGMRVVFVTHLYDFAQSAADSGIPVRFLRAERHEDGTHSYRLRPGPPLRTSFAADVYDDVFGTRLASA